jgi:ribonuclease HI
MWHWVKGHADNVGNLRADALARQGMAPYKPRKVKPDVDSG